MLHPLAVLILLCAPELCGSRFFYRYPESRSLLHHPTFILIFKALSFCTIYTCWFISLSLFLQQLVASTGISLARCVRRELLRTKSSFQRRTYNHFFSFFFSSVPQSSGARQFSGKGGFSSFCCEEKRRRMYLSLQ